jgi:hypothetical protein
MNTNLSLYSWAEANVPHYYKIVCDHVKPYLELAWDVCLMVGDNVKPYLELAWDVCLVIGRQLRHMYENVHAYVEEKTPTVIAYVSHLNLLLTTAHVV